MSARPVATDSAEAAVADSASGNTVPEDPAARRPRPAGVSGELVERLNLSWRISRPDHAAVSLKQRLAAPFRRLLTRLMATQETFNALLVQYVNAAQKADKQWHELVDDALARLEGPMRFQEALAARERRMDAAVTALRAEHEELRTSLGVLQQATRARDSLTTSPQAGEHPTTRAPDTQPPSTSAPVHPLSHRYVGFEDAFRGAPATIRANLASYVPLFAGAADVLDVGCGRGELLELLREAGIPARGIDVNGSMVDVCREQGLRADAADALSYLRQLGSGSLGGLVAAQVVEHLEPAYLTHLLDAAFDALRPGSRIVLETINPACWFAFFESYVRDITHVRPLHPDTLKFLLVAAGFQQVEIQYRAPYPEHQKLQPVAAALGDAAETLNANAAKLNSLLFTHLDYAAVARRP